MARDALNNFPHPVAEHFTRALGYLLVGAAPRKAYRKAFGELCHACGYIQDARSIRSLDQTS